MNCLPNYNQCVIILVTTVNMNCNTPSLPTGPAGADGADGADGSDGATGATGAAGADGTSVLYQSLAINSPTTISSTFSDAVNEEIDAGTLVTVGDTLRVEFIVMNENEWTLPTIAATTTFSVQVLFGTSQMLEYEVGIADANEMKCGATVILDLIVTATNTITPRLNELSHLWGARGIQWYAKVDSATIHMGTVGMSPAPDTAGAHISPASVTLTSAQDLQIQLKNSDNLSTSLASVTSITVTKLSKV